MILSRGQRLTKTLEGDIPADIDKRRIHALEGRVIHLTDDLVSPLFGRDQEKRRGHFEIAERLGIPIGTVKSRMAKAADTLRAELASLRSGGDDAF